MADSEPVFIGRAAWKYSSGSSAVPNPHSSRRNSVEKNLSTWCDAYLLPDIIEAFDQVAGKFDVDQKGPTRPLDGEHIPHHMRWIDKDIHAPAQRLEFVAKRLYVDRHALLGTPLFVALAE